MSTAKEDVRSLLDRLPDDASLEDIQYHLYVKQKIEHGRSQVESGETITTEQLEELMSKWLER